MGRWDYSNAHYNTKHWWNFCNRFMHEKNLQQSDFVYICKNEIYIYINILYIYIYIYMYIVTFSNKDLIITAIIFPIFMYDGH